MSKRHNPENWKAAPEFGFQSEPFRLVGERSVETMFQSPAPYEDERQESLFAEGEGE